MKIIIEYIWKIIEHAIHFFLVKVLHMELTEKRMEGILQFFKFGIVGLSNTVIAYVIYVIVLLFFQTIGILGNIDYLVSQVITFILSVLWSFYWNNKYVFNNTHDGGRNIVQALMKAYMSYAFTGLFLSSILSVLWVQFLEIDKMIAPLINLLIKVPINFIINKFWTFK